MLPSGELPVTRPVKVALVIEVGPVRAKSSPVSISNPKGLSGRVAVAIFPSGFPVLKKNGPARTGRASNDSAPPSAAERTAARRRDRYAVDARMVASKILFPDGCRQHTCHLKFAQVFTRAYVPRSVAGRVSL